MSEIKREKVSISIHFKRTKFADIAVFVVFREIQFNSRE